MDDALSCHALGNGKFQVGVHIADVSHFVKPHTAIDTEAAHRATTVYLINKVRIYIQITVINSTAGLEHAPQGACRGIV